ncbi:MAG: class I SAM-dependent methyltransferase [Bacteroidales bacterium]
MEIIVPPAFPDYELIDSGNHEKLERFGRFIICRPEPQALWNKNLPEAEWEKMAHAVFRRFREQSQGTWEGERGEWKKYREMPDQWNVQYTYAGYSFRMRLGLTAFGHVGIFPEQSFNWNFLIDFIPKYSQGTFRLLNLFAYTGASSLAARAAGADVTHVDSVKNVLTWARQNMEASGLNDIRWVPEDAMKFIKREVRRGNRYQGILLDPPAYGRGPAGEKWILNDHLNELIHQCASLLDRTRKSFLILNMYSLGHSALIAENLLKQEFSDASVISGEIAIPDRHGRLLPLGIFARAQF